MAKIIWDESLSVSIEEIDDQHKKLVALINRLDEAAEDGSWSKKIVVLSDVMLELIDYLHYHFSTEEQYMIDSKFPQFDMHREEHVKFVNEVTDFADAFRNGTKGLTADVLFFLKDWFISHVSQTDSQYGTYLAENGVQ